jgi:STE24 endopeptidase
VTHGLARRSALVLLAVSCLAFGVLAAVLIPWDWLPGGSIRDVPASDVFTQAQIDRAEDYAWLVRRLAWASYAVSMATALVLGFTGLGSRLVARLPRRIRLPLGVLVILLIGRIVTLPFSLLIRRQNLRYGLTRQSLGGWTRDNLTSLMVMWVATTIGIALLVWLARRTPRWWFVWAGAAAAGLTFALSFLYPVVVEPLFNKFTPMPAGPLKQSILELADQEGVPVHDVLVADASRRTTTLNAYVSGYGNTRRVVVYDNLLTQLKPDEVRVVVAHELGHAKNHDVLTGTVLGAVGSVIGVTLLALLLDLRGLQRRAQVDGPGDTRVIALVLALAALATFVASPLQNASSRAIEARADRESLQATQDAATFISMQKQLALTSLADPSPPRITQFWFGSHPTTLQRIGLAQAVLP